MIPAMSPLEAGSRDSINLPFFEDQFPSIYSLFQTTRLAHSPPIDPSIRFFGVKFSNSPITPWQLGHHHQGPGRKQWHKIWSKVPRLIRTGWRWLPGATLRRKFIRSDRQKRHLSRVKRPKVVNNSVVGMTKMKSSWVFVGFWKNGIRIFSWFSYSCSSWWVETYASQIG